MSTCWPPRPRRSGWIRSPRTGKDSGAYMNPGAYDLHIPICLLNLRESYEGMTTFAHEWAMRCTRCSPTPTSRTRPPIPSYLLAGDRQHLYERSCSSPTWSSTPAAREKVFYLGPATRGAARHLLLPQTDVRRSSSLSFRTRWRRARGMSGEKLTAIYLDLRPAIMARRS